jgi:hypothetical protein
VSVIAARPAAAVAETGAKDSLGRRPEILAALALTALYLAVMGGHSYSIDGLLMYRQALAIVQNFSLHFPGPIFWGHEWPTSISGIGLPLVYLPTLFVLTKAGMSPPVPTPHAYDWDLFYRDFVYAIGAAPIHILVTVATAYLVARFIRSLGYGPKTALLGLAGFGIASPAIVYARGDFPQPVVGLWLIAGLYAAHRYRVSGRYAALFGAGGCLILAVLARPVEGSFLLPALLLMVLPELNPDRWSAATYKGIAIVMGSYVIAFAITLAINWGRFGSPFETGYPQISWTTPLSDGIPGVLFSPARGILWQFPLIVLGPLGLWQLRMTPFKRVAVVMSGLIVVFFFHTALWIPWWGAWSWGSRLFVPAWPLVATLAAIGAVSLRPPLRIWLTASLFIAGVVWAIPGTVTDLLGGYAGAYNGTAQSFLLSGYPPIGAWRYLHHLRPYDLTDSSALDIFWFRIARHTGNASLLVPLILMLAAAAFAWMAIRGSEHGPAVAGAPARRR